MCRERRASEESRLKLQGHCWARELSVYMRERVHWGSGGKAHIRGSQCVCVCVHSVCPSNLKCCDRQTSAVTKWYKKVCVC